MAHDSAIGVLLMTYGSPATLDEVPEYMTRVRGGREPEPELVTEFQRRYELIGGSPLIAITRAQAEALEMELRRRHPDDASYHVAVGMRFSRPEIAHGVADLTARGATRIVGIIMSPQYSPILMSGYFKALDEAVVALDRPVEAAVVGAWNMQPRFLDALAQRLSEALDMVPAGDREATKVLLSAHSMPKRVIENEPGYIAQLHETANAVADRAGLSPAQWGFCYQSAGHTPEEWLKPDFADVMPDLAAEGKRHVVIAPVQFLADHLEILYDIEVGAREQAEVHNIGFTRTASLNTMPQFIAALADIVDEHVLTMPAPAV